MTPAAIKKLVIGCSLIILVATLGLLRQKDNSLNNFDVAVAGQSCGTISSDEHTQRQQCWDKLTDEAMADYGPEAALELIAYFFQNNPTFVSFCHDLTHKVGSATYDLFDKQQKYNLSPKTSYCSYGFYHGFMERLVSETGDLKLARGFCQSVQEQLGKQAPDAYMQCFHGIGHGWAIQHDKVIKSEAILVEPALKLCSEVAETNEELVRCTTGVFNALALAYVEKEYDFLPDRKDPLKFCRTQTHSTIRYSCYISMNLLLRYLFGPDYLQAAKFVEQIPEDDFARYSIINLGSAYILEVPDFTKYAGFCRQLQTRLRQACIQGYAFGFLERGEPEKEYIKSLAVCTSDILRADERQSCLDYMFLSFKRWYSADKFAAICKEAKSSHSLCTKPD